MIISNLLLKFVSFLLFRYKLYVAWSVQRSNELSLYCMYCQRLNFKSIDFVHRNRNVLVVKLSIVRDQKNKRSTHGTFNKKQIHFKTQLSLVRLAYYRHVRIWTIGLTGPIYQIDNSFPNNQTCVTYHLDRQ
jgi:hypothetical protein